MALEWIKFKTVLTNFDCWGVSLESVDYFVTLESGKFISTIQNDECDTIAKKEFNTLNQAKKWCERKERKRLVNAI